MKNSKRKSVFGGTREVADTNGGEINRAVMLKVKIQDNNFIKLYKPEEQGEYYMRPREMTLAAIHLFDYLCIIAGKDNMAATTTIEIEERIKYSSASIARAKDQLRKMDYIRQKAQNIYMINPEVAAVVDGDKRRQLSEIYAGLKRSKK